MLGIVLVRRPGDQNVYRIPVFAGWFPEQRDFTYRILRSRSLQCFTNY